MLGNVEQFVGTRVLQPLSLKVHAPTWAAAAEVQSKVKVAES